MLEYTSTTLQLKIDRRNTERKLIIIAKLVLINGSF